MRRPVWLLAPAILVATMACGHSGPAASQGTHSGPAATQGTETTFYLPDSGRDVTVNVGDPAEHPRGDFTFTALAPGRTQVVVINTFACPPATVHGCSKPEQGNTPSGSPAASPVPGVFTLTVHVV